MRNWAELLVARERIEGVDLTGDGGLLTGLAREVLQCGLEVEMASGKKQSHVVIPDCSRVVGWWGCASAGKPL